MSGHSHWATTHRQKGLNDAKKGALFTKAGRDITIAAQRGGDPDKNFTLRMAIDAARAVNMPKENIERAIKKGTGELAEGARIEEIVYEGFGPGNVALLIGTATDNKNRTVSELKSFFTKNGGKLGAAGSVSFLFKKVGVLFFALEKINLDELENSILETKALDFVVAPEGLVLYTEVSDLESVRKELETRGFVSERAELTYIPSQTVALDEKDRLVFENFLEKLDEQSDVQKTWDNLAL